MRVRTGLRHGRPRLIARRYTRRGGANIQVLGSEALSIPPIVENAPLKALTAMRLEADTRRIKFSFILYLTFVGLATAPGSVAPERRTTDVGVHH